MESYVSPEWREPTGFVWFAPAGSGNVGITSRSPLYKPIYDALRDPKKRQEMDRYLDLHPKGWGPWDYPDGWGPRKNMVSEKQ